MLTSVVHALMPILVSDDCHIFLPVSGPHALMTATNWMSGGQLMILRGSYDSECIHKHGDAVSANDMCKTCNDIRIAMTSVAVHMLLPLPPEARHHILLGVVQPMLLTKTKQHVPKRANMVRVMNQQAANNLLISGSRKEYKQYFRSANSKIDCSNSHTMQSEHHSKAKETLVLHVTKAETLMGQNPRSI